MSSNAAVATTGVPSPRPFGNALKRFSESDRPYPFYLAFAALIAYFSIASPFFFNADNFLNIARQTSFVSIVAIGMTFVIATGEIDLSVGSTVSLSAMLSALVLRDVSNVWLIGALAGLGTGIGVGLINGFLVARIGIPSFLVTLGTLSIVSGLAQTVTNTQPVIIVNNLFFQHFGNAVIGIPAGIFWTLVALLITIPLLHYSTFGRKVIATGGKATAAHYSGINTVRVKVASFVIVGMMAGLAGVLAGGQAQAARPDVGAGLELTAIAAVVLGGASLFGGRGSIVGTLIGSLMMGVLNNGLVLVGVNPTIQLMIVGAVIIAAVAFTSRQRG
jgi:ribose/xylose/arabinose/galactoside ABC-type transport system permease subunit